MRAAEHATATVALRARQRAGKRSGVTCDGMSTRSETHALSATASSRRRCLANVALVGLASRFPALHPNPAVTDEGWRDLNCDLATATDAYQKFLAALPGVDRWLKTVVEVSAKQATNNSHTGNPTR
eukprot:9312233-Pyramimonas_sp.AAC.3